MPRDTLTGTLPRWVTAIALSACVYFLQRMVRDYDTTAEIAKSNYVQIERLKDATAKTVEAFGKIDQITRLLEMRITSLEAKQERVRN